MKAFCTFFTLLLLYFPSNAQIPVNDDCAGIINLGTAPYCSAPAQYTNVNATLSVIDVLTNNIPLCFNDDPVRDVWFQFNLPSDGSLVDIEISVLGNTSGNGTLKMPQVALYRGDCAFGELTELACAVAPSNVNKVHLQQFGLTPGIPYFLRINDFSSSATPNSGTFKLCIEKYVPAFNMGATSGSQNCAGTLYDSGGALGDYKTSEDLNFKICPQDPHQCILLNVESYATESAADYLRFYQGDVGSGLQLTQISGSGNNFQVQIPAPCATVRFVSDFFNTDEGFKITWTCSPNVCTTPPPTTCYAPTVIPGLPYVQNNLSNCFSGNTINNSPCADDEFLVGNDYVFTYVSAGDECVKIATNGTNAGAGIGIYNQCPSFPAASCIASSNGDFGGFNPIINAAFLEKPGTYYIVFGAGEQCSPFNFSMDTVTCPVVLPSASTCDKALDIGGCSNKIPEIIALNPGAGDPNFIQNGLNQGCFDDPQFNYSFFYFTAGANGKFGFTVESAKPDEASDIDINVWGPINNVADICNFVSNNQPVRSTWAAGPELTGLADIHPVLGTPVTDDFDCGSVNTPSPDGDDFVRRLDVQQGKVYVIMLDDYGNAIIQGGILIDFSGTTDGVLTPPPGSAITTTPDTAVCPGKGLQLAATGGVAYVWSPDVALSCSNCQNPVATPTTPTSYQVKIASTCDVQTRTVKVGMIDFDLGPDVTVCNNATFTLNPNGYQDATYTWVGPPGLSCYNCPSPTVSGLTTGIYTYIATLTTPDCVKKDTIKITVIPGQQPQYGIVDDKIICAGTTVQLGGPTFPNTFYQWTSVPTGFTAGGANPSATPLVTTEYFLVAFNASCPLLSVDSVLITVFQPPVLQVQGDTAICNGESVLLGTTIPESDVTYKWTPNDGSISSDTIPNPLATPLQKTLYQLTAKNTGCTEIRTVEISVVDLDFQLNVSDTALLCKGNSLQIQATVNPSDATVEWMPLDGLILDTTGLNVIAMPSESILYMATVTTSGCIRVEKLFVQVDSLPKDLNIFPSDTTICQGEKVLLSSTVFETADYPNIEFKWSPPAGQLTPDSLYNMLVQPSVTTVYQRITTSGVCSDTSEATVNVIQPAIMVVVPEDTLICANQSVQLQAIYSPGVTNITWSPPTNLSCTQQCNNPIATPNATTIYTVTGQFQGCPVSASTTLNVKPLPAIQFPNDTQLCGGESVTLNQTPDLIATYSWTSTDPNFLPTTNPAPMVAPAQTATYFVQADKDGCKNQGQITITVTNATLTASNDTTVCQNFPVQLTASGSQPGTYQWSDGQMGQAVVVMASDTTTYTVTYTFGDNCKLTAQVTVNIDGVGAALDFPDDTELCPGESVLLNNATPSIGATYSWTSTDPSFVPTTNSQPTASPNQTAQYTVTATLDKCTFTKTVSIIVYNASLTMPADVTICTGETANLAANGSLTGKYLWSTGDTTATIKVSPTTPGSYDYDLLYTYGDGCTLEGDVKITVLPNFSLKIVSDPDTNRINVGEPISLMAVVSPSQNLSNFQFQWLENGSTNIGNTETIELTPSTNDSSVFYVLTVTAPNGCKQDTLVRFTLVQPLIVVPNAFTPNGDDVNDLFRLKVIEGSVVLEKIEIYNRWGQKVFESSEQNAAWDGTTNGKEAPSDVYAYIIRWRRGDGALQAPLKGDITLLR